MRPVTRRQAVKTGAAVAALAAWPSPAQAKTADCPAGTRDIALPPPRTAWFGAYPGPGDADPEHYEATIAGRQLAAYRRFYAFSSGPWPTADDAAQIAAGRLLVADLAPSFTAGQVTWAQVTAGQHDTLLAAIAGKIAAVPGPVMISWSAEPELTARQPFGTADDFVASWRHVWNLVSPVAPNAVWCWDVSGTSAGAYYPGDAYVDWVAADPYDPRLAKGSPLATYQPFITWLNAQPFGKGKPAAILETGVDNNQPDASVAAWIEAVPEACQQLGYQMWLWFNSSGTLGSTSVIPGSQAATAMAAIGSSPFFTTGAPG